MTKRLGVRLAVVALACAPLAAQQSPSRTREYVKTLASERFEGRLAGSDGERLAADYIASHLQRIGVKPLPGQTDLFESFDFTAGTRDGGSTLKIGTDASAPGTVRALSFSDNGDADGPIVFAGYGIVVPESQNFGYDSYAGLDVKDKIVLVLRYFPEDADQKTRGILARYSDLRYKAMAARQHGAKAMIVVTGPRSPNAGELAPMTFDTALAGSGIVAVSVTRPVVDEILRAMPDKKLEGVQQALDSGNPHVAGFAIPDVMVHVHASVVREKQTGRNVVGYLPATERSAKASRYESEASSASLQASAERWIIVGAHYDHLGRGDRGSSLASKDEAGRVHFGADDNASGTAAVLGIAEILAKEPRQRPLIFAFWSGEELGLIGSNAFVAKPPVPANSIEAYLNFDMVGRMQDNKLTVQAIGTSPAWPKLVEQANVGAGFDLQLQSDPYQPTDVATFSQGGIPSLSFFTGTHADYHRPSDSADKIDYEDLDRVVEFACAILRRLESLDAPPQFTKVDLPTQPGDGRAGVRVFTGTIPDYSTDVKGLLLSGVIGGGPAEQAGLQKGDVIVEIAGQSIANIYDYTYALDVLKIGQPVKVIFLRNGQRKETMLTPAARK
jgi:hypothetical protein